MRWIKAQSLLLLFVLLGCQIEVHDATYDNPFDLDANKEKGIIPPALIFSPSRVKTTVGGSATMKIFALEVSGVGGVHAQVNYDATKLSVTSVTAGSFFSSAQSPIFIYEDNNGTLDVYVSYLGPEITVSGTGDIAIVVFNAKASGEAVVRYTSQSELLGSNDVPIKLNGLGQGVVNAK